MEELIMAKDVPNLEGGHHLKAQNISSFLSGRKIFAVTKKGPKNLYSKKQIEESLKKYPYKPDNKKKYKSASYVSIDTTKYLVSKEIQRIYADRLPASAKCNFSSWALLRGLKPAKKVVISPKFSINAYCIKEVEELLVKRDARKTAETDDYIKEEEERNSDCIYYLTECLTKAAIKNKKINCLGCFRYKKKEFKYYETT